MRYLFGIIFCAMALGCAEESVDSRSDPIRVAVLPDQAESRLLAKYAPLLEYLRATTGLEFKLLIPEDYSVLLKQFDDGQIDLAWFGGLTFVQAAQASEAIPLVFRDVDLQFTSCYLARTSDRRTSIREFEGDSFSFGPTLSTSGHLMPRYYMTREGLEPETFFSSVWHSTGHDDTALRVSDGAMALGVANCVIVQSLFDSGDLDADKVRIIETTPPYSDYVWTVSPSMDQETRIIILNAFLALDGSRPEHREILRQQGANAYMPAGESDFELVRMAAVLAGALTETDDQ